LLLVAILFPPLFEMKLALSQEEESQCTFQWRKPEAKGIAGVPKRMKQQKCQVLSGTRVRLGGQPVGH